MFLFTVELILHAVISVIAFVVDVVICYFLSAIDIACCLYYLTINMISIFIFSIYFWQSLIRLIILVYFVAPHFKINIMQLFLNIFLLFYDIFSFHFEKIYLTHVNWTYVNWFDPILLPHHITITMHIYRFALMLNVLFPIHSICQLLIYHGSYSNQWLRWDTWFWQREYLLINLGLRFIFDVW